MHTINTETGQGGPAPEKRNASRGGVPMLVTTAGDWEREARSRRHNLIEAFAVYLFLLVVMWPFGYGLGVLPGNEPVLPLVLGAVYLLFVSPFIHRDTLGSWGLGNPKTLWLMLTRGPGWRRGLMWATVALLFIGLNCVNWWQWAEVADFFNFEGTPLEHADESFPGILFVFAFGALLSLVIIGFGVRYDNFVPAFKTAMKVALPLFALVCLGAYVQRGAAAFSDFRPSKFALDVFGYLFWGFTQQLLFSAYFGTRLRKAYAPSRNPRNTLPKEQRWRLALLAGGGTAVVAAPGIWLLLRLVYPETPTPASAMLWFAAFALPVGGLYGYFWGLDRKRLLVATVTGSFFGFIHIDSYGLVIATWVLGIFLSYVFMAARNRNLVALGFIHGLNGSTLGWLFSSGKSGVLEIDYSVGPWNVDNPTAGVLIIPMALIAAYSMALAWSLRRIKD